jgi:uncharacterized protein YrrD
MTIKTSRELDGLAVVSLSSGERLGRVEDVVFHPASGRVTGFLVNRGGMFTKPKYLAADQVQALGADALTIKSEEALTDSDTVGAPPEDIAAKQLDGRPVLNQAGIILGKIADIALETEGLTVPYLVLATGLLDNALHGKPQLPLSLIQTIGADSVIVSNAYDPKPPDAHM